MKKFSVIVVMSLFVLSIASLAFLASSQKAKADTWYPGGVCTIAPYYPFPLVCTDPFAPAAPTVPTLPTDPGSFGPVQSPSYGGSDGCDPTNNNPTDPSSCVYDPNVKTE